jgi:hypothetical protein
MDERHQAAEVWAGHVFAIVEQGQKAAPHISVERGDLVPQPEDATEGRRKEVPGLRDVTSVAVSATQGAAATAYPSRHGACN